MHFPNLDPAITVNPSADRVARFLAGDAAAPALILNLHEYHARAHYPEGYVDSRNPPDVGGREAYHRYFDGVLERILPHVPGVRLIVAPCELTLIGDRNWHEAVIGYYPTRKAMLQIASLPEYAALVVHRTAGLKVALTVALHEPSGLRSLLGNSPG
jgi:hypothetical protein